MSFEDVMMDEGASSRPSRRRSMTGELEKECEEADSRLSTVNRTISQLEQVTGHVSNVVKKMGKSGDGAELRSALHEEKKVALALSARVSTELTELQKFLDSLTTRFTTVVAKSHHSKRLRTLAQLKENEAALSVTLRRVFAEASALEDVYPIMHGHSNSRSSSHSSAIDSSAASRHRHHLPAASDDEAEPSGSSVQLGNQSQLMEFDLKPLPYDEHAVLHEVSPADQATLRLLNKDIAEMNALFRDMGTLVAQQQEPLDVIEDRVTSTEQQTNAAVGELGKAAKMQRGVMLPLLGATIGGFVLGGPVGAIVGAKTVLSLGLAGAGGALGFMAGRGIHKHQQKQVDEELEAHGESRAESQEALLGSGSGSGSSGSRR